ncbi:TPA: AbrB/MazE/SpoVT family DNA-binding domain-containing protein [Enterococcus faecium]|nr:AbrB/MazE/SpoVT family DNA-binding domain-containing protein [Enterococcus faecium]
MAVENKKTKNDKFVGSVKVGPKGQIVIPKEAREMLNISTGDTLVLLADAKQGIAVQKYEVYEDFFEQVFNAGQSPTKSE